MNMLRVTLTGERLLGIRPYRDLDAEVALPHGDIAIADTDFETLVDADPPLCWCSFGGERHLLAFPGETMESLREASHRVQAEG